MERIEEIAEELERRINGSTRVSSGRVEVDHDDDGDPLLVDAKGRNPLYSCNADEIEENAELLVYLWNNAPEIVTGSKALVAEVRRLQDALALIQGNLIAADEKEAEGARCSADRHREEALAVCEMLIGPKQSEGYTPSQCDLRGKTWENLRAKDEEAFKEYEAEICGRVLCAEVGQQRE